MDNGIFEVNATDVRMEGCLSQPCIVERGKDYLIEIDFTSSTLYNNTLSQCNSHFHLILIISVKAHGRFSHDVTIDYFGEEPPWPSNFPNGCDSLIKGDCPLVANEAATASALLEIRNNWPAVYMNYLIRIVCSYRL